MPARLRTQRSGTQYSVLSRARFEYEQEYRFAEYEYEKDWRVEDLPHEAGARVMSEEKLVTVRRCGPVWEAEMLRDRLEAAGIRAFVQGAETNRTLSYAATALGGVKVQVAASEVAAAEQVLIDDELQRATAGSWQCPRCDEINDAAFDVCWNCSMPRGDAFSPERDPPRGNEDEGPTISVDEILAEAAERTPETFNPYQSLALDKRVPDPDQPLGLRLPRMIATVLLLAAVAVIIAMTLFASTDPAR